MLWCMWYAVLVRICGISGAGYQGTNIKSRPLLVWVHQSVCSCCAGCRCERARVLIGVQLAAGGASCMRQGAFDRRLTLLYARLPSVVTSVSLATAAGGTYRKL